MSRLALRRRLLSMEEGEQQQPEQTPEAEKAPAPAPAPEQTPTEATPPAAEPEQSEQNPEGDASDKEVVESQQNADGAAPVDDQMPAPGETNDLEEEIAKQDEAISETAEAIDALESYRGILKNSNEAFSLTTATLLDKAVNAEITRLNKYNPPTKKAALESMCVEYNDPYARKMISMEFIGEVISTIWEKISAMISAIVDKVVSLFGGSSGGAGGGYISSPSDVIKTASEKVEGVPIVPKVDIDISSGEPVVKNQPGVEIKALKDLKGAIETLSVDTRISAETVKENVESLESHINIVKGFVSDNIEMTIKLFHDLLRIKSQEEVIFYVSDFLISLNALARDRVSGGILLGQPDVRETLNPGYDFYTDKLPRSGPIFAEKIKRPPEDGSIYFSDMSPKLLHAKRQPTVSEFILPTSEECDEIASLNKKIVESMSFLAEDAKVFIGLKDSFKKLVTLMKELPKAESIGPYKDLGLPEVVTGTTEIEAKIKELISSGKILSESAAAGKLGHIVNWLAKQHGDLALFVNNVTDDANKFVKVSRKNLTNKEKKA